MTSALPTPEIRPSESDYATNVSCIGDPDSHDDFDPLSEER